MRDPISEKYSFRPRGSNSFRRLRIPGNDRLSDQSRRRTASDAAAAAQAASREAAAAKAAADRALDAANEANERAERMAETCCSRK